MKNPSLHYPFWEKKVLSQLQWKYTIKRLYCKDKWNSGAQKRWAISPKEKHELWGQIQPLRKSWEIIGIKSRQIRIWPQVKQWDLGCTMECSGKRSIIKPKKEPQIVPSVKIKKIVILIHTKKEPKYLIKYWFFSIMRLLGWSL